MQWFVLFLDDKVKAGCRFLDMHDGNMPVCFMDVMLAWSMHYSREKMPHKVCHGG